MELLQTEGGIKDLSQMQHEDTDSSKPNLKYFKDFQLLRQLQADSDGQTQPKRDSSTMWWFSH